MNRVPSGPRGSEPPSTHRPPEVTTTTARRSRSRWSQPQLLAAPLVAASSIWAALVLLAHHLTAADADAGHVGLDHALFMTAAMTVLAAPSARVAVGRALERRWLTCLVGHVLGYAAVWFVVALGLNLVVLVLPGAALVRFGVLLAAASRWQLSWARRRRMDREGWVPVGPPIGWAATRTEVRGGVSQACRCVVACWASMLAMAAAPTIALGLTVLAVNLAEWWPGANPHGSARRIHPAIAYGIGAVTVLALAVANGA